jgi:hypothetical protein
MKNLYRNRCPDKTCVGSNSNANSICVDCVEYNDKYNACILCKTKGTHKLGEFCADVTRCRFNAGVDVNNLKVDKRNYLQQTPDNGFIVCWCCGNPLLISESEFCGRCLRGGVKEGQPTPEALRRKISADRLRDKCIVCKKRGTDKVGNVCASPCRSPEEKKTLFKTVGQPVVKTTEKIVNNFYMEREFDFEGKPPKPYSWMQE